MLTEKNQKEKTGILLCIVLSFYIFLSYFEIYLQQFLGPINRFYMLAMAGGLLMAYGFQLKLNAYNILITIWFGFKCLSILWSNGSNSQEATGHLASQIGIVIMTAVLSGIDYNKKVLSWCIRSLTLFSFLYGILSILFSKPYLRIFTGRQVLSLFGVQNDPNNCAAFLIFAVSIALYSIVFEGRYILFNTVIILVGSYAIFLTGSRAGFLSIVLAVGVIILLIPFRRKEAGKKDYTLLSILIIILLGLVLVYFSRDLLPSNIRDRLLAFDEYEEGSGRASKWENAMKLFLESPVFGKGWGGYVLEGVNEGTVHNTFITSLCDIGVVGTTLLVLPILLIVIQAIRKKELLAIVILADGVFFSLSLDAINKRFFWNAIYIAIMLLNYHEVHTEPIYVWEPWNPAPRIKETKCKYIR